MISREEAWKLLKKYNKEEFHLQHALTLEGTMRYFAKEEGYGEEADYWAMAGLLHDLDFELYPDQHCTKTQEILREYGFEEKFIRAVASHGYGLCTEPLPQPEHTMEKILFATDELTGLIGAAARMRPSKSVMDMEVSSIKKKFKDKKFAGGCSRDVIKQGADMLGWELDKLFEETIMAMRSCEESVNLEMDKQNIEQ
ncbi:HDIG domain-containing metalloprotein [Proteocatella sphenisci]|uniref:HDIG domain-containing metalloprotein n=1 Tax=Proteocatella sphenisci TaxID=181070 RepID=UPI000490D1F6|nr:HDIG domain-containing metalloprotein [Proteocatella sphenisci]